MGWSMIERLQIENFRCLRHVDVPLRPLTVLIGPNDSGKSSFLDAVLLLQKDVRELPPIDQWKLDLGNPVRLVVHGLDSRATNLASTVLETPAGVPAGYYTWSNPAQTAQCHPIVCFRLPSFGMKMNGVGLPDTVDPGRIQLESDGSNLAAMLDLMLRSYRPRFFALTERLRQLVPGIKDLNIGTPYVDQRRVDLYMENDIRLPADLASTGVKTLIFFLTLAYRPGAPKIVLVEEPENGIHPRRLGDVMGLLRGLTTGAFGESPVQVILSTHSPYLLDHVNLEQDQVLVFQREGDGSRSVEPADRDRLLVFLDEFQLGEVWFNEHEAGLVTKP